MTSRRTFLLATGSAAAAFLSGHGLGLAAFQPASLVPLIETMLPFNEDPFRAIGPTALEARVESLFHLTSQPLFAASLAAFSDVRTFPAINPLVAALERRWYPDADIESGIATDARSFAAFSRQHAVGDFPMLDQRARTAYTELWRRSAFGVRRRFYQSIRSVIFAAAYSLDSVWHAIGYAGPLLKR